MYIVHVEEQPGDWRTTYEIARQSKRTAEQWIIQKNIELP